MICARRRRAGWAVAIAACLTTVLGAMHPAAAEPLRQPGTPASVVTRTEHTTTLLADGRVLVVGGRNAGPLASAALFDPVTATWSITGSLAVARYDHTATLLPDGRVLVAGGSDCHYNCTPQNSLRSAELYDPATGTWTRVADMTATRTRQFAGLLADGRVLVAGGEGLDPNEAPTQHSVLQSAETYDPVTDAWTAAAPMHFHRDEATAVTLPDRRVAVMTGTDFAILDQPVRAGPPDPSILEVEKTGEIYDAATGTWTLTTVGPAGFDIDVWWTALPNGLVLGLTGFSFQQAITYDHSTDIWTRLPVTGESAHTSYPVTLPMVMLSDGRVLASGGEGGAEGSSSDEAFIFDPATAVWTPTRMTGPRQGHAGIRLVSGQVLVFGGEQRLRGPGTGPVGASRRMVTSELYDPATGQ
jgi:hypothetical protein